MVDLVAKSPCAGLLPLTIGAIQVKEVPVTALTGIAAYKGQQDALADAFKSAHGLAWPAPNRATGTARARAIWFARDMAMLQGAPADPALGRHAALTDQSDAWAVVELSGAGAADVLARLTPIDLRESRFKRGHTARTDLRHMMASITRLGAARFQIMVFRGFAETLVHDLQRAMETVAAR